MLVQTVHWEVSCWSHSITHLPKVGAWVNCRLVGAADHYAWQSLLSTLTRTRKENPLSPIMCLQCPELTKLNVVQASKGKICRGLTSIIAEQATEYKFAAERQQINAWHTR